jgi:hypothetical protein
VKIYVEDLNKEFDTEKLEKRFGTFKYNNKPIYQIDDAFPDGTYENPIYKAYAINQEGNRYKIIWKQYTVDAENECYVDEDGNAVGDWSDGANACNWDDYKVTEL